MVFSKELRVPKEWLKYHDDILKEPTDPELFSEDDLFGWIESLGLCHDKSVVAKYAQSSLPYFFQRLLMVIFPKNALCKELFKHWANLVASLFITDDFLETTSEIEMGQVCDAFKFLADQARGQFPRFPTIAEMRQSLLLQKIDENLIPHAMHLMDLANNIAKSIIKHGGMPIENVNEYWKRLLVLFSFYYIGVAVEVKHNFRSNSEEVWTGILSIAHFIWLPCLEITSGAFGKLTTDHLTLINELYFLSTFSSRVVNDIYSYNREVVLECKPFNFVRNFAEGKEVSTEYEAVKKNIDILNATVKLLYQKLELAKKEHPASQELCKLFDYIGMAIAGVFCWHHHTPRYADSPFRVSVVGIEEDELKEWMKCSKEEPPKKLFPVLLDHSQTAKRLNDVVISGVVRMHLNLHA